MFRINRIRISAFHKPITLRIENNKSLHKHILHCSLRRFVKKKNKRYHFTDFRTNELHGVQRRAGIFRNQPIERHYSTDMNTSQLQCIISCDDVLRERVLGVFAADRLPKTIPTLPCGFIANTDISSKPGQHWLAFFIRDNNVVECFDSYGQNPGVYNGLFTSWIHGHAKTVLVNGQHLQSNYSNVCGLYAVYFLRHRLLGEGMNQILNTFNITDMEANDSYILNLFSRVYPYCIQNEFVYNQKCLPISFR